MESPPLRRSLSLWLTTTYGLGTILGAGVYVLVGKVAGYAQLFAPLSFLLASIVAAFTAHSYAKLCARHPQAAGEATYVQVAFRKRWLTALTGWLVVITGVVSAAALTRGFVGYFHVLLALPAGFIITTLVFLLTLLACWGIGQSVKTAMVITLIEVGGLLLVIGVAAVHLREFPSLALHIGMPEGREWLGIPLGAFLAFYAFIGFEDMVNLAEEVKEPSRTLPLAIFLSLGIATLLYILSALAAVLVIPMDELVETEAPFALLFQKQGFSPLLITLISLVALINSVLVQIIMAARVMYGMGKQGAAPYVLARVHRGRQTPITATFIAGAAILVLALWFPVTTLAEITSFFILIVFTLVNLALIVTSQKGSAQIMPTIGMLFCILLLSLRFLI